MREYIREYEVEVEIIGDNSVQQVFLDIEADNFQMAADFAYERALNCFNEDKHNEIEVIGVRIKE